MNKNANIIIRVDETLKEEFKNIVDNEGYDVSKVIIASIKDICKRGKIPLNLYSYLGVRKKENKVSMPAIKKALQEILEKAYKDKIDKAYLFGSYSRGEETSDSDIDIRLVTKGEFTLFDLSDISSSLSEKLKKEIDLITSGNLDKSFLEELKKDEICIYE